MERPILNTQLDSKTFKEFYYLKEELVNFCRENNLPTSGGKIELTERIAYFLDTGKVLPPTKTKRKASNITVITKDTEIENNFVWMIPLSSRIEKYKKIVENKKKVGKPCDIIHIVKLDDDRESAFLIQDMFPITDEYIERKYTIAGNHLMLTSEHTVKEIEQKARKVMGMLKRGVKFTPTQPDVMKIIEKLAEK